MTAAAHLPPALFPGDLIGPLAHLGGADTLITRHVARRHGGMIELSGGGQDELALALLDALLSFSPAVEFGAPLPLTSHLRPRLPAGVDSTGPRVLRLEGPGRLPRLVVINDPAEREYWRSASREGAGPPTVFLTCPTQDGRGNGVPLLQTTLDGLHLTLWKGRATPVLRP